MNMMGDIPEGIDEAALTNVVHTFYGKVRDEAELGPVFDDAISDWPHHLGKMVDFWSSVMLTTGRYKGNPVMMHMKHKPRITPALFNRWLALWGETTDELLPPEAAAALQARAARIAESLQLALFFRLDGPPSSKPSASADLPAGA